MTNLEPIITCFKSGKVKITDCLIIAEKGRIAIFQERGKTKHQFKNIHFLSKPKWWHIRKWIKLIKIICKAL